MLNGLSQKQFSTDHNNKLSLNFQKLTQRKPSVTYFSQKKISSKIKQKSEKYEQLSVRIVRGLLVGSLPIALGACLEFNTRPYYAPDYIETQEDLLQAKQLFDLAQKQYNKGSYQEAISNYKQVIKLAPQRYTLCMKSFLGLQDAYFALGQKKEGGEYSKKEWLWGRGIRWPGWYIIAGILFRNEIVRQKVPTKQ
eukprot:TRINITY_DN6542_c1_g1_i1.p1 TRINITY_DN6542_c1_g1~~TRINITY_DN6542_c1_g1_i1.p1  ORF type:complete len:195 (-),score=9.65 TRINITY_DN6542_c1_g1_i1:79-663(-)